MRGRSKSHLLFLVASAGLAALVGPGSVLAATPVTGPLVDATPLPAPPSPASGAQADTTAQAGEPAPAHQRPAVGRGQWVRVVTARELDGERPVRDGGTPSRPRLEPGGSVEVGGHSLKVARLGTTVEGTVDELDERALFLMDANGHPTVAVPRNAISNVDIRVRESKKGAGLLIGLVAGAAIGFGVGAATSGQGEFSDIGQVAGAIFGAAGGGLLGLAIAPGAEWERAASPGRVRVSLWPAPRSGMRLSVSLGF
ncbi:MAG TPA: hypothetical protein VMT70_18650 [Vicinamibacteria bacterium]|nr:hypothetical protein [Vicinamibacteria bacterium]